jgi:hypothetical protein
MKKVIKLKESQLLDLIKKKINEQRESKNYMFFSNLEQIKRQIDDLMGLPEDVVDNILMNGHDWADDHISKAKENIDHVYEFMMNEMNSPQDMMEAKKKKKKENKLCARGIAAAKAKYDVYPSAYANGYAVQVCKGDMPGLDGQKRCSGSYC